MLEKENPSEEAMNRTFETSDVAPVASESTVSATPSNLTWRDNSNSR